MADGSRQTGGLFLLRNGAGAQRVAEDSRFGAFSWDAGLHQRFIISTFLFRNGSAIWTNKRFVTFKLDMLIFVATEQKLHVSSGKPISHAMNQYKCNTQILHLQKGEQNRHVTCLKHINCGRTWWCCRGNEQDNFPDKFLPQSWQTQKTYCEDRILSSYHNTTHLSGTF